MGFIHVIAGMKVRAVRAGACAALIMLAATAVGPASVRADAAPGTPITAETVTLPTGTTAGAEEKKPEVIEPHFIRTIVPVEAGRNDANPLWSPQGAFLAFERSMGDKKEIRIVLADGTEVQTLSFSAAESRRDSAFLFPGLGDETSYNAGLTWSPDGFRFVYMSNGGEGNYDLYLQDLGGAAASRLTDHKEKDGQAAWSPAADSVVFVSGRTGKGDLYRLDLKTRALARLTQGGNAYLYPHWSPDGHRLAVMHGSNENHDIIVINDPTKHAESQTRYRLTTWTHDDLRPIWSPDGKKIAFYSNQNDADDPRVWSLFVVAANGSDPSEGEGLAAKAVARDILPDVETGPAWMPDSARLVFVKNERQEYNPLYVADIRTGALAQIRTDTKMNHDVAIAADGAIAFRAQVNQWDQLFIMKLKQ